MSSRDSSEDLQEGGKAGRVREAHFSFGQTEQEMFPWEASGKAELRALRSAG
jgi:hypothetical protein